MELPFGGKFMFPLSFNAIAKDNAYTVVKIEEGNGGFMFVNDESQSFLSVEDDNAGNVVLTAQENTTGKERLAYILVMPQKVFDEIKEKADNGGSYDNILLNSDGKDLIESKYDAYVALAFKQEGTSTAGGFKVLKYGYENIPCSLDKTSDMSRSIATEYGISPESIYSLFVESSVSLTINPLLSEWNYECMGQTASGNEMMIGNGIEPTELEGAPAVMVNSTETMYVIFISNGAPMKALIINVE